MNSYYYFKEEIESLLPRNTNEELAVYIKRYYNEVEHNGNKKLKAIRQKSKQPTFGMNYGAYPPKLILYLKCTLTEAEVIWNRYHNELYPDITKMREKVVLPTAINDGRIHLGLGCYMYSSNPNKEIRTLNNACSQFWSILTLLTINKFNIIKKEYDYQENIKVISSIYDSIYFILDDDPILIKFVNDQIIPLLTKDFLVNQIVKNSAEGEIGYDWYNTIKVSNDASLKEIEIVRSKLKNE